MAPTTKPLFGLTAADLMSTELVLIPEDMSLKSAARRLANAAVTGAPVVNSDGRCVGVLSATDFLHWMDRSGHTNRAACAASPAFTTSWQNIDPDRLPDDIVRDYMTRDAVTVHGTTPLAALTQRMIDVHIHRVIVVDQAGKVVGVVSSTDVLAAVVRAAQARQWAVGAARGKECVSCHP
jgi:CBS domain-containing protein